MGNCIYCSKPAGIFRKKHKECEQKFLAEKQAREQKISSDKNEILSLAKNAALGTGIDQLKNKLNGVSDHIDKFECNRLTVQGWESAVEQVLSDNILTKEEEGKLSDFLKAFSLTQADADQNGYYTKIAQAGLLRDLVEGKIPTRVKIQGNLPFNFKKGEEAIWLFKNVQYYEQKTRREFVGRSQGVSVRIARGLYYRVGAFKGHPVERTENVHVDNGLLAVTNEHIYFAGPSKSFRIPFGKIVTMVPYSDGICIQRDAASAKPQSFVVGDGWFINNLIGNLCKL